MRVVVIGGGPAGVSAALHAAELGAEVTLVERGRVGGTALNSGPAPVRTLARAARLVRDWSSWETFGLRGPRPEVVGYRNLRPAREYQLSPPFLEELHVCVNPVRVDESIVISEQQQRPLRMCYACVFSAAQTESRLIDCSKSGIGAAPGLENAGGLVGRSIVDDDNLERRAALLAGQCAHAIRQVVGPITGRNDDANSDVCLHESDC